MIELKFVCADCRRELSIDSIKVVKPSGNLVVGLQCRNSCNMLKKIITLPMLAEIAKSSASTRMIEVKGYDFSQE